MYTIIFELNYYNGPIEGICQSGEQIYYYCMTDKTNIEAAHSRAYYLYELNGSDGRPLTWSIITEEELVGYS